MLGEGTLPPERDTFKAHAPRDVEVVVWIKHVDLCQARARREDEGDIVSGWIHLLKRSHLSTKIRVRTQIIIIDIVSVQVMVTREQEVTALLEVYVDGYCFFISVCGV